MKVQKLVQVGYGCDSQAQEIIQYFMQLLCWCNRSQKDLERTRGILSFSYHYTTIVTAFMLPLLNYRKQYDNAHRKRLISF